MKTKPVSMAAITRQLSDIGNAIAQQYAAGHGRRYLAPGFVYGVNEKGVRYEIWNAEAPFIEFTVGGHKARCLDCPDAVATIVRKYRNGPPRVLTRAYSPTLPAPDRSGYGVDYGALEYVEHEILAE